MAQRFTKSIVIEQDLRQVFALWANFENFPFFMRHIRSVRKTGPRGSHWVMTAPFNRRFEWDAATTVFEENSRIAWKSTGGDIETNGEVRFQESAPGQTIVTLTVEYGPLRSLPARILSRIFINPDRLLEEDLENFKRYSQSTRIAA